MLSFWFDSLFQGERYRTLEKTVCMKAVKIIIVYKNAICLVSSADSTKLWDSSRSLWLTGWELLGNTRKFKLWMEMKAFHNLTSICPSLCNLSSGNFSLYLPFGGLNCPAVDSKLLLKVLLWQGWGYLSSTISKFKTQNSNPAILIRADVQILILEKHRNLCY